MKKEDFYKKTPLQLKAYIYRVRYTKGDILDMLRFCGEYQESDNRLSVIKLCEKHQETLKDTLWEDLENGY